MNQQKIEKCHGMIIEFKECREESKKNEIRNKLFLEMKEFILRWVSSVLSQKGEYLNQKELQSKSWDCFLFALRHFKTNKNIPIPNHFYAYTKFKLFMKDKVDEPVKRLGDTDISESPECSNDNIFTAYEHLEELFSFRKNISPNYQKVFDDAVHSMMPGRSMRRQRHKEVDLTYTQYREAKKVFKMIVEYLLIR